MIFGWAKEKITKAGERIAEKVDAPIAREALQGIDVYADNYVQDRVLDESASESEGVVRAALGAAEGDAEKLSKVREIIEGNLIACHGVITALEKAQATGEEIPARKLPEYMMRAFSQGSRKLPQRENMGFNAQFEWMVANIANRDGKIAEDGTILLSSNEVLALAKRFEMAYTELRAMAVNQAGTALESA